MRHNGRPTRVPTFALQRLRNASVGHDRLGATASSAKKAGRVKREEGGVCGRMYASNHRAIGFRRKDCGSLGEDGQGGVCGAEATCEREGWRGGSGE